MVGFESALERDFATQLEFDPRVIRYEEQPLEIEYRSRGGQMVRGVPDFLVTRRDWKDVHTVILADVKYRREIFERWSELKPRLKAARQYAMTQGWKYRIYTEVEIRTPYLHNARFLLPYQRCAANAEDAETLFAVLGELGETTPAELVSRATPERYDQARLIPTMWKLIADRFIGADLNAALTMTSRIWGL